MPNSRGSAFVAFSSADEATRAVTEMNGKMAGTKPLYVALAQRKEDRRMRLQAQFAQRAVANVASECARAGAGDAVKRPPAPDARIARVLFHLNSYRTWRRRRRA